MIWFAESQGPGGFPGAFSGDRPFLSLIYILTTSILKNTPLQWQTLGIFSRWLLGLSFWWWFKKMWHGKNVQAAWAGILIVLFPGFKQQPISVVYGNGLILLVAYIASYALMLLALENGRGYKKVVYTLLALITYTFCLFSTEYYVGLEILRPIILWLRFQEPNQSLFQRVKSVFLKWLPYFLVMAGFLVWRVLIFEFPTYQPSLLESLADSGVSEASHVLFRILRDSVLAGWQSWSSVIQFPKFSDFSISSQLAKWVLILLSGLASFFILRTKDLPDMKVDQEKDDNRFVKEILLLAGAGLLFAGFPFWITKLPIELTYPYDRFLLAFLPGSCLLVIGLIEWVIKKPIQKIIILSMIMSMSIGSNFINANSYRREWITHNELFWQMAWRAPAVKENTIFMTYNLPFQYYSDNSLTAPLNLLYAPDNSTLELPYYLALINVRLGRSIPALEKNLPIQQSFRNAEFIGNTSDTLVFFYSPPGCLRILDPQRDEGLPVLPVEYSNVIQLSDTSRIITEPDQAYTPSATLFGEEPAHTWCYYFQKADLERQKRNWENAFELLNEAFSQGYSPAEPSEYIIYLESLFHTERWDEASTKTANTFFEHPKLATQICGMLNRVADEYPEIQEDEGYRRLIEQTDCFLFEP